MNRTDVMTTEHPRWDEFIGRLEGVECDGMTLSNAESILQSMGGIDVAASLEYFRINGGYCDCEIRMNIAYRS